ncbi:MAG: copper amine oxidase N-terminal domain-containing protein, partial [Eubacteriales bacterium]|nr:copper amine oxidase N-terminal domain-containing protein [Eubacteriales bacterium]
MKRFENLCVGILAITLTLSSASVFAQNLTNTEIIKEAVNSRTVKVTIGSKIANINENNVTIDVEPYIQKNTNSTMIPLRFVATALGISENNIKFDTVTKTVTIEDVKYSNTIEFYVNKNVYRLNGKNFNLDNGSTVEIKNGRTFIPFRTLGNAFKTTDRNVEISWDAQTKTAIMKFEELAEKNTSTTEKTTQPTTQKQNNNTTTEKTTKKQNYNITTQKQTQTTIEKQTE